MIGWGILNRKDGPTFVFAVSLEGGEDDGSLVAFSQKNVPSLA